MGTRTIAVNDASLMLGIGAAALLFVLIKGGLRNAAASAAGAVVDAAGGVATGTVDAVGQGVGLPALADITTDAHVARWIMDHPAGGRVEASVWASASAFASALWLDVGSGTAPPPYSRIAQRFPIAQYVAPLPSTNDEPQDRYDAMGNYLGYW